MKKLFEKLKRTFEELGITVIIDETYFSKHRCDQFPALLYVFGDNTERIGKGGQACIRDCENAFGIATKISPTNQPEGYFTDEIGCYLITVQDIMELIHELQSKKYKAVVFPADGLGTGLSDMPNRCPNVYYYMNMTLNEIFGTEYPEAPEDTGIMTPCAEISQELKKNLEPSVNKAKNVLNALNEGIKVFIEKSKQGIKDD